MPVVSCKEIDEGRSGQWNYDQSRQYVRSFRVTTDDDATEAAEVMLSAGLPAPGDPYPDDPLAVCRSLSPSQDPRDARLWIVAASYDSKIEATAQSGGGSGSPGQGGAGPAGRAENPLDRPVEWRATTVKAKKAVTTDKDGEDVKNSAGEFYSPGYERDIALGQIVATKNYEEYPFLDLLDLVEKVNDGEWYGFAEKTVKIDQVDAQSMYENGVSFVRVTWTFLYNPDGWNPTRILDRGTFYLDGANKRKFVDADGNPLAEGLLNGAGGQLVPPAVAVYNLFRFHDETSFTDIP